MCTPLIDDCCWHETRVSELGQNDTITLLGRELRVRYCQPSPKGGDFWILEAYSGYVDLHDVVSFTVDKNTTVYAREAESSDDCAAV